MEKVKSKIILPEEILNEIKQVCKARGNRDGNDFRPVDLLEPLFNFISDDGEKGLKSLNPKLYNIYKNHSGLSSKTLGFVFQTKGDKDDGAKRNLCDLLCHLRFKMSWENVLIKYGFKEDDLIEKTKKLREKWDQDYEERIFEKVLKKKGKSIQEFETKSENELADFVKQVYIELTTRKAGIPIEEDKDVIEEIYNSWYKLFCVIREEMKLLPVQFLMKNKKPNQVYELVNSILNDVLRPHLTDHQAKFRNWLGKAKQNPEYNELTPQELQKKYPEYLNLITSLKATNKKLVENTNAILKAIE